MVDGKPKPSMQSMVFFTAILVGLFFLSWLIFKPFVITMALAVLVAVLALPIDRLWEKLLPNKIAAFGTLFTIFVIIMAPVVGLSVKLANDSEVILEKLRSGELQEDFEDFAAYLLPGMTPEERNETIAEAWSGIQPTIERFLVDQLQSLVTSLPGVFIAFTVMLFVIYYVLTDGWRLLEWLRRAAPLPPQQVDFMVREAHNGIKAVFFGQILTSLIQGALGGLGFFIVGIPGAVFWGAVMAVISLLPVIGTPVIWLPAVGILFAQGDIRGAIILLAYSGIIVMQVDNFVRPLLIGSRADIHPLFVLIGVLGGVAAFGFVGLFLGPLLVGITVSILKVWESDYLNPELREPAVATADADEAD